MFLKNFLKQNKYILKGIKRINYRALQKKPMYNFKNIYTIKQRSGRGAIFNTKNNFKALVSIIPASAIYFSLTFDFTQYKFIRSLNLNLKSLLKVSLNSLFYRQAVDNLNFVSSFNFWNYSWLYFNNHLLLNNFKYFFHLIQPKKPNHYKISIKSKDAFQYFRTTSSSSPTLKKNVDLNRLVFLKKLKKLIFVNTLKLKNKYQLVSFEKYYYNVFPLKKKIHLFGTSVYKKHRYFEVQLFRFLLHDLENKYLISPTLDGGFYGHNDSKYGFNKKKYFKVFGLLNVNLVHENLHIYDYIYRSYELNFDGMLTTFFRDLNLKWFFFKNINLNDTYGNRVFWEFNRGKVNSSFKLSWYLKQNNSTISYLNGYKNSKNFIFKKDVKAISSISNLNTFNYYVINNFTLIKIFTYPVLFKYFLLLLNKNLNHLFFSRKFNFVSLYNSYNYSVEYSKLNRSNVVFNLNLKHAVAKKVMLSNAVSRFRLKIIPFVLKSLIDFLESISGRKVMLMFNPFLMKYLTFEEIARCLLWFRNLLYFRRVLGHHLFLLESLKIVYLALKLKDPVFFVNWVKQMLYKISFFKFKFFLRYLKYIIRAYFQHVFHTIDFKGIKMQLKGKVSVSGNARTRTVRQIVGKVGQSTLNNRILYNMQTIWTFTGSISLRVWFYF